jgi:uncharacterized membrane protein
MNQNIRTIVGIIFLLLSVISITLLRINPSSTTPVRSTESRKAGVTEGVIQGFILTQEFTAIKDYLCGIDLIFTHAGRNNNNENTLLILGPGDKTIFKTNFSSAKVNEGALTSFMFENPVFVGKNNLLRLCLFSNDGTESNAVSLLFNRSDSIGALYVSKVSGDDLGNSIKNKARRYLGSLMIRTYETNNSQFWLMKIFLYFIALTISCLIIWFTFIRTTLIRTRIIPEWVFLAIALPVSTVFTFITPPLQVPDEGSHFLRAYELAEFKLVNKNKTSPESIMKLDSAFGHLHFLAGEKTSIDEIKKHLGDKLEPGKRAHSSPPAYTIPYIPPAIGILIGKTMDSSPLTIMYLGRIFNLLISILLIFFAIRITPQFKWIFFLLAMMPKTLFLFGSISYDSLTISLSFFTTAVFLYYAFKCERKLDFKDLGVIAVLVLLLLLCKPPYFLVGMLFFFIPPKKFGYLYKYIMILCGVVVVAVIIFKAGPAAVSYFSAPGSGTQVTQADPGTSNAPLPVIRPDDQIKIILNDVPAYLKLITKSGFVYFRSYILNSFVGLLGWIDVKLPAILTYSYLIIILLAALSLSGETVTLGIGKKTLLIFLLLATYIVVESAMFIYATRPGRDRVFGVQGRYFIPMAPLFFMLFYNSYLNPILNLLFSTRRKEYIGAKVKVKPAIFKEIQEKEQLFDKSLYLFLICFCTLTLLYSIYVTMIRYYNF